MNRHHGDPEPPDPATPSRSQRETSPELSHAISFSESPPAAWLWHDLALPLRIEPLSPTPEGQDRLNTWVLDVLRTGNKDSADELYRMCLGLSEGAPDLLSRAFWQLAAGTFEALALQALPWDENLKRLVSQVLQQYHQYEAQPNGRMISEVLCHQLLEACLQAGVPPPASLLPLIRQAYAGQALPEVELALPGDEPLIASTLSENQHEVPALSEVTSFDDVQTSQPALEPDSQAQHAELSHAPAKLAPVPADLAPVVVSQAMQWSHELAEELSAWAPKPSRPLKPAVTVLAQVTHELLSSAGLPGLAAPAQALHAALLRSQRLISVLPNQADVLVQAAHQLHHHMQTLSAGSVPVPSDDELTRLNSWPPALQIQEQLPVENTEDLTPLNPVLKVKRPEVDAPDGTRLWYVQSIRERLHKALQPQGLMAELVMHDPGVALLRSDLQQLGHLLDLLLPALRTSLGEAASAVLHISLQPEHHQLTLDLHWQDRAVPLDDLEMSQAWQMALSSTSASLQAVGPVWRLTVPAQLVLCTVQLLRAGDFKLAAPTLGLGPGCFFNGRNPSAAIDEVLGIQEVLLQAPSPLMRRVHGVVGVMPKDSGLPVLVYRADLFHFLSTP